MKIIQNILDKKNREKQERIRKLQWKEAQLRCAIELKDQKTKRRR